MDHKENIRLLRSGCLTRREVSRILASAGIGVAAVPAVSGRARAEGVDLSLLEWNGYELPEFHPEYAAMYGGEPEATFFGDVESAFQKMRAGFKVDLVHPCSAEVKMFKDADLIKPLDTSRIERWNDILPSLLEVNGVQIDGQYWMCPWDWGYSVVAYNPDVIQVDEPTFDIFVDPAYKGKTALNSQIAVNILIAGVIGGWANPNDPTEEELAGAPELFNKMVENSRFVWDDDTQLVQSWVNGDVGISYVYGSSVKQMHEEGIPAEVVEPVMTWLCGLCLSSDGPGSEDQAYDYINAMLDPVGGKALFDAYGYGHANSRTFELIDPDVLKEKGLDDPAGLLARGVFFDEVPPEKMAALLNMFNEAQAGF